MFKYVCLLLLSLITLRTMRGFRTLSVHERSIENNLLLKITVDNVSATLKLLLFFASASIIVSPIYFILTHTLHTHF